MDIIVSGTIVLALPIQSGVSQRGNQWSRASYVIEHESGQYPKRLVFDVKDAKIQEFALQAGQQVTVHLNADAHEWPENSGKWFNNLTAWKVERPGMQQAAPMGYQQPMQGYQPQYQQNPQYAPQPAAPFPPQQQYQQQPAPAPFPPQQPAPAPQPQAQMPQAQMPQQGQQLPFPPAQ